MKASTRLPSLPHVQKGTGIPLPPQKPINGKKYYMWLHPINCKKY